MDLSGTMQAGDLQGAQAFQRAGGVGGLLLTTDYALLSTGEAHYPTYDANGNVSEYLDASGTIVAHYQYDAFGNTIVKTGTQADTFSHRFSTKPLDSETGLYYYGYRYYDPVTGRWPSRDPIEEEGGVNLYGMLGNNSVNGWDYLGQRRLPGGFEDIGCFNKTPCIQQCDRFDHACLAACRDAKLRMNDFYHSRPDGLRGNGRPGVGGGGVGLGGSRIQMKGGWGGNAYNTKSRGGASKAGGGVNGGLPGQSDLGFYEPAIATAVNELEHMLNGIYGDAMGALGNILGGFSDGVLLGQGHNLARLVHGSDTPWADTSSGYYTGGLVTGIGATTVAGGVVWTRGGEALARNGGFHLSRHVARETTSQYFTRSLLPATRTYSETLTRSLFTGANRSLTRGRGVRDFLTTRTYSNGSSIVSRNILTNRVTHYNPYRGF